MKLADGYDQVSVVVIYWLEFEKNYCATHSAHPLFTCQGKTYMPSITNWILKIVWLIPLITLIKCVSLLRSYKCIYTLIICCVINNFIVGFLEERNVMNIICNVNCVQLYNTNAYNIYRKWNNSIVLQYKEYWSHMMIVDHLSMVYQ